MTPRLPTYAGGVACKGKGVLETYLLSVPHVSNYDPRVVRSLSDLVAELEVEEGEVPMEEGQGE